MWMHGIRQWEEVHNNQSPLQMHALRAHTESVLRGELLAGQLLEPEVLHFATRFRPLFHRLFTAYADECAAGSDYFLRPEALEQVAAGLRGEPPKKDRMSFPSFFRFCVDFEIFPKHGSFEEIYQLYGDAETVEEPPAPEVVEPPLEKPPTAATFLRIPGGSTDKRASTSRGSSRVASPASMDRPSPMASTKEGKEASASRRKAAQAAATAAAAAAAAAAIAALPKVHLDFFQKRLNEMSEFELQTVAFLAGIDEWLSDRSTRLADQVSVILGNAGTLEDLEARRCKDNDDTAQFRIGLLAQDKQRAASVQSHLRQQTPERRASVVSNRSEATSCVPSMCGDKRDRPQTSPTVLPPTKTLSARELRDLASQTGPPLLGELSQIERIFRFLITGVDDQSATGPAPDIPVFQLDKAIRAASEAYARFLMCGPGMLDPKDPAGSEAMCCQFIKAFVKALADRASWDGGRAEDVFAGKQELSPVQILEMAETLGVDPDIRPPKEALGSFIQLFGANPMGVMSRPQFYMMLCTAQETRKLQLKAATRARSSLLSTVVPTSQSPVEAASGQGLRMPASSGFGLSAFVECLLKLALHRLGSKGQSDIQRGSPAWWKCTWLLTLLGGSFGACVRQKRFAEGLLKLSEGVQKPQPPRQQLHHQLHHQRGPSNSTSSNKTENKLKELHLWWDRIRTSSLPKYLTPLERLAIQEPDIFDPANAEEVIQPEVAGTLAATWPCEVCQEPRSPSGWGNPACIYCSGVEEYCLPIEKHLFAALLKTTPRPPVVPVAALAVEATEESPEPPPPGSQ